MPTKVTNKWRDFYGTGWFPISLLVLMVVSCAIIITLYVRNLPAKQADVATVQAPSEPLQLKPKDAALDQQRIKAFLKPELILFCLFGIIPLIVFTVWVCLSPKPDRSALISHGLCFMLVGLALVGINYVTDCVAFQILTDKGYVVFQRHNGVLMWVFTFIPGGIGAGIFVNALTSSETRESDLSV
jgi:hypothetical protein